MEWQFTPYAVPLFVGSAMLLFVIANAWQHRSIPGATLLILLSISTMIFALGYAFELGSSSLGAIHFWLTFEYLGIATVPVWLFMLALVLTNRQRFVTKVHGAALLVIPVVTIIFAATNPQHELIWKDWTLRSMDNLYLVTFTPGAWYWVHVVYIWCFVGGTIILFFQAFLRASGLYRKQFATLLLASLIPMVMYFLYLAGLGPPNIDITAYSTILSAMVVTWGIFHYRFLDIMPVAREAVIASMTDAIIVMDQQRRVVDMNPVAQNLLEIDPQQYVGRPTSEVFARWSGLVGKYQQLDEAHDEVVIGIQGEEHCFDLRLSSLKEGDKLKGRLLVMRDITQSVETQKKLQATNDSLKTLRQVDAELSSELNVDYVAMMTLDAAIRMSQADTAFLGLVEENGIRVIQALGNYQTNIVNRVILPEQGITSRVVRTGKAELILDVTQDPDYYAITETTKAQMSIPLVSGDQSIGVVTLESRRPERFTQDTFETVKLLASRAGIAIDNANIYEERERLVAELDAFAHTVAHDLKNPLALINGYGELALDMFDQLSKDQFKNYFQMIVRGGQKANAIIEALLLLAGVRSASLIDIVPVDMLKVVSETRLRFTTLIDEHKAEIIVPDSWPVAEGYAPWIEEIWANYFSNAIKYGGQPPRVELGYDTAANGKIRFWVKDNGAGLTEDEQNQLFRPFTRLNQVDVKGHGLGLSIVQRIAARLKGEVGVQSQPGEGSLFYFTLPAADTTERADLPLIEVDQTETQ